jgi:plasmid stabilization system protein ParE
MKPAKEAPGYSDDLQIAYDYYKAFSPAVAARFVAAYETAHETILYNPFVCRARKHGWRQMVIRDYPSYSIFYKELPNCWLLGGVVATMRDPDFIQASLLIREVGEAEDY